MGYDDFKKIIQEDCYYIDKTREYFAYTQSEVESALDEYQSPNMKEEMGQGLIGGSNRI